MRKILFLLIPILLIGCGQAPNTKTTNQQQQFIVVHDTVIITVEVDKYAGLIDTTDFFICKRIYTLSDSIYYFDYMYNKSIHNGNNSEMDFYYTELYRMRSLRTCLSKQIYRRYLID